MQAEGIGAMILEATAQGYDIEIRIRRRNDGKEGRLIIPVPWARKFGMTDEQIDELQGQK
jgi:hypothetical protein